jgi:hypothetical protein
MAAGGFKVGELFYNFSQKKTKKLCGILEKRLLED